LLTDSRAHGADLGRRALPVVLGARPSSATVAPAGEPDGIRICYSGPDRQSARPDIASMSRRVVGSGTAPELTAYDLSRVQRLERRAASAAARSPSCVPHQAYDRSTTRGRLGCSGRGLHALKDELVSLRSTRLVASDSPTTVGSPSALSRPSPPSPMMSLDKVTTLEEILAWGVRCKVAGPDRSPSLRAEDRRLSISLNYERGRLVRGATEGWPRGRDVTPNVRTVAPSPTSSPWGGRDPEIVEIRGGLLPGAGFED